MRPSYAIGADANLLTKDYSAMNYSFIRKHVTRPSFALVFVVIVLVAGVIYSNIYHCPFVFDDEGQIVEKVIIRDLTNYLSFEAFLKPRPIVDLTFALNYRFGQLTVFGYHLVNVLIHIINGFLVYFLALTMLKQLLSGSAQRFDKSSKVKGERSKVKGERSKVKGQSSKDNPKHKTSNILLSDGSAAYTDFQSTINNQQSTINLMSLFAALIFIAHPIQTQAVTYIVQRYTSLAAMFYMGSVLFYLKARIIAQRSKEKGERSKEKGERGKLKGESKKGKKQRAGDRRQRSEVGGQRSEVRGHPGEMRSAVVNEFHRAGRADGRGALSFQLSALYSLSILCGMLAFLSKQSTASLPAAIILVEYLFIDRTWQGWKKKILWFTPIFILFVILVLYVSGFFSGAVQGRGLLEDVSDLMRETELVSRWSYLCTQFNVLVIYIRLLFLPIGQNLDYLYPFKTGFFDGYTPLAFLFLTGIAALGIWNRNRRPVITFGIFWFFITLSVESSIFPIKDALFEHRLYLPMFGFAIIVSWLVFHFLSKRQSRAIIISTIIIVSLGTATFLRNRIWQDSVTLWTDVAAKAPHNPTAHNNLGEALGNEGRLKEAIKRFSRAVRINPGYLIAYNNLGLALIKQGKHEDAVRLLSDVRKNKPKSAETCVNLGVALQAQSRTTEAIRYFSEAIKIKPGHAVAHYNLGNSLGRQGKTEEKIRHLSRAIQIDSLFGKAYRDLGVALLKQGRFAEAIGYLSDAAELMPDSTEIHINLGITLMEQGRADEAIRYFFRALRIKPNNAITLNNLGAALAKQGRYTEAVEYISKALKIKSDYGKAHYNLGAVLEQQGKLNEAIYHFSESLRIKPDYARAHYNLGIILARQGNFEKAISHYSDALRLKPDFSAAVYYNMACIYARQNKTEESIAWLKKAIKSGYKNCGLLKTDKDLENIRSSSYYKEIVDGLGD